MDELRHVTNEAATRAKDGDLSERERQYAAGLYESAQLAQAYKDRVMTYMLLDDIEGARAATEGYRRVLGLTARNKF